MPRARNIKPAFFANEDLADLPPHTRLLFIALWTLADRAGRLEDRPKRIKAQAFPYEEIDVDQALEDLQAHQFIARYQVGGQAFVQVIKFEKHQHPHHREADSTIPAPGQPEASPGQGPDKARPSPSDSLNLIPDSLKGSSGDDCFAAWWGIYPKKVKKKEARKIWNRMHLDQLAQTICKDTQARQEKDGRWLAGFVPDPTTYLNGERWKDEIEPPRANVNGHGTPRSFDEWKAWAQENGFGDGPLGYSKEQFSAWAKGKYEEFHA